MLCNGLLIYVEINVFTGDVRRINFDKYFLGKIISENICDGKSKKHPDCTNYLLNDIFLISSSHNYSTTHSHIIQREPDYFRASSKAIAEEFLAKNLCSGPKNL